MKRPFVAAAMMLLACSAFLTILSAADDSAGNSWSGTYRGRVLTERFLHRQALMRPVASLTQEQPTRLLASQGQIAVIDSSGGVVAQPNFLDLQGATVSFLPDGDAYFGGGRPVEFDETARANGVPLALGDDDSQRVTLPFSFPFFGAVYTEVFVNSDGNLTFGEGDDGTETRSLSKATTGPPRIAPLFADLDPSATAAYVRVYVLSDRVVVTCDGIPTFGGSRRHIFQTALHDDGAIEFHYLSVNVNSAVVGIFPGGGQVEPAPVDLSGSFMAGQEGVAELFQLFPSLDPMTATRRFYADHGDAYDFIFLFNNFGLSAGPGTFAFELDVRNDIVGIGDVFVLQETFDLGDEFGSPRRLASFINTGSLSAYPDDPNETIPIIGENNTLSILGQEAGHRWGVYTEFLDPITNQLSDDLLGRGAAHWNFFFNSRGSVMEGSDILDTGPGVSPRYVTGTPVTRYGDFDQYIMGLRSPEQVVTSFLVEQPQGAGNPSPGRDPESGVTFDGIRKDIPVDAIIAAEGPRQPNHTTAQRSFNFAFVLVIDEGAPPPSAEDIAKLDRIRREWEGFFEQSTDGRAEAETDLRRALHLSAWPRASILAGKTAYATLSIDDPLNQDLTIGISSSSSSIYLPSFVTIPAASTSAALMITGSVPGTATIQATVYTTGGEKFDFPSANIQVLSAGSALDISIVSGDNQHGAQATPLAQPVVVRVTDQSRNPLMGAGLLLNASGDGSATISTSPTEPDGRAEIAWTLSSIPGPNELVIRVPGMSAMATVSAESAGGPPVVPAEGIVNAASYEPGGISPGSVTTVFGINLAPVVASADSFPLTRTLAGVQVFVGGVPVPLYFVSPSQINFQVPFDSPSPTTTVSVTSAAGTSIPVELAVARVHPGVFFDAASGLGALIFPADGLSASERAAHPGEFVSLFGVGLGEVSSPPELGEPASGFFLSETVLAPTIAIGEKVLPATFSGLAPGFAGLYQVNFQLPADLLPGRYELSITTDGVMSNQVFIDIE